MISNPTPQRALRGHMPQRPTPRAATSGEHHARLARHLTPRDRWLAHLLFEHKVLTTHQIVELAWTNRRTANERLRQLYTWRVLDRFQPFITHGVAPMHYVLDIAGAVALAYEHGLDPKNLGYRHEAAVGIAHSLRLAHTVGLNGWFTSLAARSRTHPGDGPLTAWWSETRCARLWGDVVRPDGYGRWREHTTEVEFFVEFDFGTESLRVLAAKISDYHRLAVSTGIITPLLVWLPTNQRETTARKALAEATAALDRSELVPVATSTPQQPGATSDPATDRWLPIPSAGPAGRRITLAQFAGRWPYTPSAMPAGLCTASPGASVPQLNSPEPLPPDSEPHRQRRSAA